MSSTFIIHDSHNPNYRTPFGAVPCDTTVRLGLELNTHEPIHEVFLHIIKDGAEESIQRMYPAEYAGAKHIYTTDIKVGNDPGLLWYYFKARIGENTYCYGNNHQGHGGVGTLYEGIPRSYQITVHRQDAYTPQWYKEAVMYQIFVDRFYNGSADGKIQNPKKNSFLYAHWDDKPMYIKDESGAIVRWDFFGGNLQGIIEKLDYFKELGISVLYLNPIFESPSNHKYDTADYKKIDPMFGDHDIFRELCQKAKEKGIYILLDGVFSHTGSDSVYFNKYGSYPELGAYQSPKSPYYKWYRFGADRDTYDCWWGFGNLPNVEEMEPTYRDFIIRDEDSVIKYWMKQGAKGWRLDVADELPDAFIQELKAAMKETDTESVLIGEVWEDASNKMSYGSRRKYLLGEELDSIMNYPFRNILIDFMLGRIHAKEAHSALMSLYENYPMHHFYANMNLIGTHDVPRILTLLGEAPPEEALKPLERVRYTLPPVQRQIAIRRLKLMALLQMTFPGVPCIYYGDEVGVEGFRDPLNRSTYPWGEEDTELLEWYKKLTALRKEQDMLTTGQWISLHVAKDVYGYIRLIEGGKDVFGYPKKDGVALVLVNRNEQQEVHVSVDLKGWCKEAVYDLLEGKHMVYLQDNRLNMTMKPLEGKVLRMI